MLAHSSIPVNHSGIDFIITKSFLMDGCGDSAGISPVMVVLQAPLTAGTIPNYSYCYKVILMFNLNLSFWNQKRLLLVRSSLTNENWSLFS